MVGRTLQFQQASSPLVNVALRLLGVQTPLVCDTVSRFLVDSFASVLQEISFSNWWRCFESRHRCEFLLTAAFSKIFCLCED
ncbi:hypothetical protein BDL97_03G019200 [Sphagnum fallax]|nr:hypothetical protein BDL97_03G019200 [Sphagnum fallax]